MGTKKKTSNGTANGSTIPVASNENILSRKKPATKTTRGPANGSLLEPTHVEQLIGLVDYKELLNILIEVRNGNFSVRMPIDQVGISGKICDTLNEIISINEKMMQEFTRAGNTIGKQGKLTQRIELPQ